MKVLITGNTGQIGREVFELFNVDGIDVTGIDSETLDYCRPDRVREWVSAFNADWVINCAAYTNVDLAEQENEKAYVVNSGSVAALAEGISQCGGRLLHISSDYIFDGKQSVPYSEEDKANPIGVYGKSKLEGELAALKVLPDATILRTAWAYGIHGNNFVKTILNLAAEKNEIRVIDDQVGTPTWAKDIARTIFFLVNSNTAGVYNYTNEGVASWYDFAYEIVASAKRLGYSVKTDRVIPIPASEYRTLATRPAYSVLSKRKIRAVIDCEIPHWRKSLNDMLDSLRNV